MRADNTEHVVAAARRRRDATAARAAEALVALAGSPGPVTVARLAQAAGVSRSWIYTQPELRERLHELAERRGPAPRRPAPDVAQAATTASLRRRLELSHDRVRQLTDENRRLREELATAYGRLRVAERGGAQA